MTEDFSEIVRELSEALNKVALARITLGDLPGNDAAKGLIWSNVMKGPVREEENR